MFMGTLGGAVAMYEELTTPSQVDINPQVLNNMHTYHQRAAEALTVGVLGIAASGLIVAGSALRGGPAIKIAPLALPEAPKVPVQGISST